MKGLSGAESAAYSDACDNFEQSMGNPQPKGFPQLAVTVELIRASLTMNPAKWLIILSSPLLY